MRPGIVSKDSEGKLQCRAIFSRIVSLFAEQNDLQYAVPGGLIGRKKGLWFVLKPVSVHSCILNPLKYDKFCFFNGFEAFCQSVFSGVGTKIDPTLCRADRMVGQVGLFSFLFVSFSHWQVKKQTWCSRSLMELCVCQRLVHVRETGWFHYLSFVTAGIGCCWDTSWDLHGVGNQLLLVKKTAGSKDWGWQKGSQGLFLSFQYWISRHTSRV